MSELLQSVLHLLIGLQMIGEVGQDPSGQGDVGQFHIHTAFGEEMTNDRQE